jgi:hypothetical protein
MTGFNTIGDAQTIYTMLRPLLGLLAPAPCQRPDAQPSPLASVEALLLAGHRAHLLGRRRQAIRVFRQVTRVEPRNQEAWLALACVVERPALREQYLRRTLAIDPQSRRGHYAAELLGERNRPC